MRTLGYLVRRDTKLFFKDKGVFFTSLIAPLIILLLFITFLGNVYRDSFLSCIPEGLTVPDSLTQGFVGGWLMSSLLAVCCVTVAFSANMIMVQDRVTGAAGDFSVTPVKRSVMSLGYYLSTVIVTGVICYVATGAGFLYLAFAGWYLSAADVLLVLLDVFLLVLFGTALSSCINFFLTTDGRNSCRFDDRQLDIRLFVRRLYADLPVFRRDSERDLFFARHLRDYASAQSFYARRAVRA